MGEIHAVEMTKVSDQVFLKFGFDVDQLMTAARQHDITPQSEQLKAFSARMVAESR